MTEIAIVVATESGQCRSFRHMADAHVFVDQLIALGEQVLLAVINPARNRYSLQAIISADHEDETRGWDRPVRRGRSGAGSVRTAHPSMYAPGPARAIAPYTTSLS